MSFLMGYYAMSWTEPDSAPPAGNISAPINVSTITQGKAGILAVSALYDTDNTNYFINPGAVSPGISAALNGLVGIGTTAPGSALDINGVLTVRGTAAGSVSAAGQGKIYFDSTAKIFKVSSNGGNFQSLLAGPYFYKEYCCWRCHGSNNTGTPDSCSSTCTPPACASGDTDYGIHGVMTGGGVTSSGNPSAGSVKYGVYFNGYGYYYRLCATTKITYETSCCWRCHASDTTGKPTSCTYTCVPPSCNTGDTDLGIGNIALGGSISIMGPVGGINTGNQQMNMYAIGYGQSVRTCRKE
jgi:hypothetical protein